MKSGIYPLSRKENIVIQEMQGEVLVYDLAKNKALCLNQTSAMIWQECDGTKSVTEISRILSKNFKTPVSEDFIWLALQQFKKDELLENNHDFVTPLDGLNRREVIKRIGFASMVALPIVASVIAPTAVAAQSGGCGCFPEGNGMNQSMPGCACLGTTDCCNGPCSAAPVGGRTCGAISTPAMAPACCPAAIVCPSAATVGIPPGCGCNPPSGGACLSGNCLNSVCRLF